MPGETTFGLDFLRLQERYSTIKPLPTTTSLPPTPEAQTAPPPKRFKWQTGLDNIPQFCPKTAIPTRDITAVKWSPQSVKSVHRSSEGSLGVYFVQLSDGTCTVIKAASNSLISELFCNIMSQALGIRAPKILLIRTTSEEGNKLLESLKAADPTWVIVARLFDQAYLYHMEYCRGQSIGAKNGIDELFIDGNDVTPEGAKFMESIGMILCLDILVNNGDRMPLIWDNQGNAGNLFLSTSGGKIRDVINLDTQLRAISKTEYEKEFNDYISRVKVFFDELMVLVETKRYADQKNLAYGKISHVLKMIQTWTGTQIPIEKCVEYVSNGILLILRQFKDDHIKDLMGECKKKFKELEVETPNIVDLSVLNNGFLDEMISLFQEKANKTFSL